MNLNETTKNKLTLHQFGIRKGIVCIALGDCLRLFWDFFEANLGID